MLERDAAEAAKERIVRWGRQEGLSSVGIAAAERPSRAGAFFEWLRQGRHASMQYLARDPELRVEPPRLLDGCRAVLCAAIDYGGPEQDPAQGEPELGRISRYAWGDDYHEVLKEKLVRLAGRIEGAWPEARTRVAVDTSPVLEKAFAAEAGLGWIGKHTNLIDPRRGSWFFLGEIFTTLPLPADRPVPDRCGSCVRCIEVCPTGAIVEPYALDAGRCLSFWNIEHRGVIEETFRTAMGNWIFGCDLCQEVCPWNRRAAVRTEERFAPRRQNLGRRLSDWRGLTIEEFRGRFRASAVKRTRYDGLLRNITAAVENVPRRS